MVTENETAGSTDLGTMSKIAANMWKKCSSEVCMVRLCELVYLVTGN
jgi:hypothetical protein